MILKLLKPNMVVFGYALFLAVNATANWGGTFPLLPVDFQTYDVLALFSLVQSLAFWVAFFLCMAATWYLPNFPRQRLIQATTVAVFFGSLCLIAPLYLWEYTLPLVCAGGILLGVGTALFFVLWQRVFAAQVPERGNLDIVVGTAYSALLYVLLHIIPIAVAIFCIALIAVPVIGLCLTLASRNIDLSQPMFEDAPRQHQKVYSNALRFLWRSALCVGSFGFASGIARALALSDPSLGFVVNLSQMAGALMSALLLVFLWRRYSFHFDPVLSFRTIFPILITAFLILPFLGQEYLRVLSGLVYAFFAFALMVVQIQSAQTSRDHGINPIFIFSFFAAVVFGLHDIGFLVSFLSIPNSGEATMRMALLALLCIWLLSITLYLVRGRWQQSANSTDKTFVGPEMTSIEFIALASDTPRAKSATGTLILDRKRTGTSDEQHFRDKVSKRSVQAGERFRLTARETEIMELIARGNSVARIAEQLIVSENTVRTHSKHVYKKMNVHKRQELLDLLEEEF
jgi:DNA-binding CsgD family transcriptional regulator/MFS family permease